MKTEQGRTLKGSQRLRAWDDEEGAEGLQSVVSWSSRKTAFPEGGIVTGEFESGQMRPEYIFQANRRLLAKYGCAGNTLHKASGHHACCVHCRYGCLRVPFSDRWKQVP